MKSVEIIDSRPLSRAWGALTEYTFRIERSTGAVEEMSREIYDRGHAAAVLLHDPRTDNVVLVRQFRPPPLINGAHPYLLEVCAGILDGDAPAVCAEREAFEEAGVVVRDLRLVAAGYGNPAALTEIVSMYIGVYDDEGRSAGGGIAEEGEDIEVVELPFETAFAMIATGEIVDMKTIVLLQALAIERLRRR